jgi:hypothetical protein
VVSIVSGAGAATVEGFVITGGNADGITANCPTFGGQSDGCGGGVFVRNAQPVIASNVVTNNVAGISTGNYSADGGGLCLAYANGTVITGNLFISNTASLGNRGAGGGIALSYPYNVLVESNQVISNTATVNGSYAGHGGGIAVDGSGAAATIKNNLIVGNRTNSVGTYDGGGIYNWHSWSNFLANRVVGNYGESAVYLGHHELATFESNQVVDNHTDVGIEVVNGGSSARTLVNNAVVRSGDKSVSVKATSSAPISVTMIHNTLIGDDAGYGVYVESGYVTLHLTNTLVASHTWGITNTVPASSTVTADHTLFWANDQDGIVGTNPVYGDPAFMDFGFGGFHLGPGSAAIDAGAATSEDVDIDGDPRPLRSGPDIGADESGWWVFAPLVVRGN